MVLDCRVFLRFNGIRGNRMINKVKKISKCFTESSISLVFSKQSVTKIKLMEVNL